MLTLHQFLASHFNEKARWALDLRGERYRRISYLPGPHAPAIRRLTGTSTSTPVLEHDAGVVPGSAAIIDFLEQRGSEPVLYPDDPALRAEALEVQRHFDAVVGPAVRTAVFSVFLDEPGYLCRTFTRGRPRWKRLAYRAVLPLAKPMIRRGNQVYPEVIGRSLGVVEETLNEVCTRVAATGHLVGRTFSVADLTAASLLAPLTSVDHPDMQRPVPIPVALEVFTDRWRDHQALAWLHETYRRYRPPPAGGEV